MEKEYFRHCFLTTDIIILRKIAARSNNAWLIAVVGVQIKNVRDGENARACVCVYVYVCVCECVCVYVLAIRWLYDSAFEQHVRLIGIWEIYMR